MPRDELDALLREWHAAVAADAKTGREKLLRALGSRGSPAAGSGVGGAGAARNIEQDTGPIVVFRRIVMHRYSPLIAAVLALAVSLPFLVPGSPRSGGGGSGLTGALSKAFESSAFADEGVVLAPEGGRLDALDGDGNVLGPCALTRTDVNIEVSGLFNRVTLTQKYDNPYADKIEAVYTFPMSHRAAVDRMTMTIGDRVIEGEVKERGLAREIYEAARAQGRVASLLEQERPNIFTQSVANIEPGAKIEITISYVELLERREGEYSISFPMTVAPRYIPGRPTGTMAEPLPEPLTPRPGVVLLGPAQVRDARIEPPDDQAAALAGLTSERLGVALNEARPVTPTEKFDLANAPAPWAQFTVAYSDGTIEPGVLLVDGSGVLGGRWFYCPPDRLRDLPPAGEPFSPPTDQVPDADRITPMPTKPDTRAGHTIGVSVTINTGGPGIVGIDAPLHNVVRTDLAMRDDGTARTVRLSLADQKEIPNRDFVVRWRQTADTITESVLTHTGPHGNFFCITLEPPAVVEDSQAVPRELIFVLDTSGSMSGYPIEKAKEVMSKAIDSMRQFDTFNLITFAGDTRVLWPDPKPASERNVAEAQRFLSGQRGGGGTEMMSAIEAALKPSAGAAGRGALSLMELANLPADGREARVAVDFERLHDVDLVQHSPRIDAIRVNERLSILVRTKDGLPSTRVDGRGAVILLVGKWLTEDGQRVLDVTERQVVPRDAVVKPLRVVMFLTDGEVGNDLAIIDAVKKYRESTRVFSFGIGNSVNRFLLSGMAEAGGGAVEFVLTGMRPGEDEGAAAFDKNVGDAVQRFTRRTTTPLLTNVKATFSENLRVVDVLPDPERIADLFDGAPLHILGRYTAPGSGTVTITGNSASGPWSRTIDLDLPASEPAHDTVATTWARTKVDDLMSGNLAAVQAGTLASELHDQIVQLGETFSIMTQYTSFVAVDKLRVTVGGRPRLVRIPIELPNDADWRGFFGELPVEDVFEGRADLENARWKDAKEGLDMLTSAGEIAGEPIERLRSQTDQAGAAGGAEAYLGLPQLKAGAEFRRGETVRKLAAMEDAKMRNHAELTIDRDSSLTPASSTAELYSLLGGLGEPAPSAGTRGFVGYIAAGEDKFGPLAERVAGREVQARARLSRSDPNLSPARPAAPAADPAAPPPAEGAREEGQRRDEDEEVVAPDDAGAGPEVAAAGAAGDEPVDPATLAMAAIERSMTTADSSARKANDRLRSALGVPESIPETMVLHPAVLLLIVEDASRAGKAEEAAALAKLAAEALPAFEPAAKLGEAFAKEDNHDERVGAIERGAERAAKIIDDLARLMTLRHRLDERLLPIVLNPSAPVGLPESMYSAERGVLVSVLVRDSGGEPVDALRTAGLAVETVSTEANLVIGWAPADKLEAIALNEGVRRITPAVEE